MINDYSRIRGYLTIAIRYLELLYSKDKHNREDIVYLNEYVYWLSSLDLVRNCLYGCKDTYRGDIDIDLAIEELNDEISDFIRLCSIKEGYRLDYLTKSCKCLTKIMEMIK